MKKIKFLVIILAVVLSVVGCKTKEEVIKPNEETASAINYDYINLTMVKPNTINPIMNKDKSVGYITNLVYDGLFTINENYDVVPQLAKEYGIAQDGKSINIKLKDATWHDNTPVTSRDVLFSVNLINKNPDSPYNILAQNISLISIISDKEFNIKFKDKYAFSIDTLIFPIVSQKQLESTNNSSMLEDDKNLIGNGPYKIETYQEREGMSLVVNENYYDKLPSTMKDIKVGIVPDEESQVDMVMALQSDIGNITLNDLSKFQEKEFNITNYEARDYEYILFNYNNIFLRDVNFRRAIAHAINRERILEEGYIKDATIVNFPLNSASKYYDKELKPLEFDKEKAKEYLLKVSPISENQLQQELDRENGNNQTENNNGENTKVENKKDEKVDDKLNEEKNKKEKTPEEIKKMISELNLKIIVNKDNGERKKTAYVISDNLKVIGIKSNIVELSSEEVDKAISEKNYDLALLGWELSSVPDATSIIKNSGYVDENIDDYMNSLINAVSENQIKDIYKSIQTYVRDNVPFISLVIRDDYIVTNRRLDGKIMPNDFDVYEGISNLSVKSK
ncbi:MAG: ABC transporter substrate-binding protein [Romboutsia sp.]